MADNNLPPIIVIKRKKGGHGGHHGGAWKVAYADFVTAMMAFFLLLWLLSATTEVQRKGIADYFTPSVVTLSSQSGAGSVLGGATITVEGSSVSASSPIAPAPPAPTLGSNNDNTDQDYEGRPKEEPNDEENPPPTSKLDQNSGEKENMGKDVKPNEAQIDKAIQEREQKAFEQVANELKQAIQNIPELAQLQKALVIDQTPEGLRIQLVDQEGYSMFPRGSAVMADRTKELLDLVSRAIIKLPNKISISGHTDSTPYLNSTGTYSNWELSSDRANAARRALMNSGIVIERIATVVGRADKEPFLKDKPEDPSNRRLSIVLIRQALAPPAPPAAPPATKP